MTIRSSASTSIRKTGGQERNIAIARNLFLIVFTDFLCWFPVAVMGLAALVGQAVPGEMYAWTALFILPVNSALNPLLYTFKAYAQKRKESRHSKQITELTQEIEKLRKSKQSLAQEKDEKETRHNIQIASLTSVIENLRTNREIVTEKEDEVSVHNVDLSLSAGFREGHEDMDEHHPTASDPLPSVCHIPT